MSDDDTLLGRSTPPPDHYAPEILRAIQRRRLLDDDTCHGEDVWRIWELGWLDERRRPRCGLGLLRVPANSPAIVESKSLKLYIGSLAGCMFADAEALRATVLADLETALGAAPTLAIGSPESAEWMPETWDGVCVDALAELEADAAPNPGHLKLAGGVEREAGEQRLYSHAFKSRCPVTGQPDHASVRVCCGAGPSELMPAALARYLSGFREYRAYHEECAERIFADLRHLLPERTLFVEMAFLRRGGLDICPRRASVTPACELPPPMRLLRQ